MTEKICFVISPIGAADSDTRKRADQVLKHIIKPAVAECGYTAIRADQITEPGIITSQVIQHIIDDPLVIADLTERNPNVFYELAVRHALRRPLVQLIAKGETIPFDVAGMRTIPIDHHDLDSVDEAKSEIVKQVRAVEKPDAKIETPISVTIDLQSLRSSDNPEQRSLADLLAAVGDLRTSVASIEKRLLDYGPGAGSYWPTYPPFSDADLQRVLKEYRNELVHRIGKPSRADAEKLAQQIFRLGEELVTPKIDDEQ